MGMLDQILSAQWNPPLGVGGLFANEKSFPGLFAPLKESTADMSGLSPEERNVINYHRDNLYKNKFLRQPNGDLTTFMGSVVNIDGKETLIPTYWDGRVLNPDAAVSAAAQSGIKFPSYKSASQALERERVLHKIMQQDVKKFMVNGGGG